MGRWAQAERSGRGEDEWGVFGALADTFAWGATIQLLWTYELAPEGWGWVLQHDAGGWSNVAAGLTGGQASSVDTGWVPVPGRAYRFAIRPVVGAEAGPFTPWLESSAP